MELQERNLVKSELEKPELNQFGGEIFMNRDFYGQTPPTLQFSSEEMELVTQFHPSSFYDNNPEVLFDILLRLAQYQPIVSVCNHLQATYGLLIAPKDLNRQVFYGSLGQYAKILNRFRMQLESTLECIPIYSKAERLRRLDALYSESDQVKDVRSRVKLKTEILCVASKMIDIKHHVVDRNEKREYSHIFRKIAEDNKQLPDRNGMEIREWIETRKPESTIPSGD